MNAEEIRIVIVEDMDDIVNYFTMVLNNESDMHVLGSASNGADGANLILETKPDIVLTDIQMEHHLAGIQLIENIKKQLPEIKFIVLTAHDDDEYLFKAFAAGATEFILKTASLADILYAVRSVHKNQHSLQPETTQKLLDEFSRMKNSEESLLHMVNLISELTKAELDVLLALRSGKTIRQIAQARVVEEVTIRTQVSRILKKMNETDIKKFIARLEKLHVFALFEK